MKKLILSIMFLLAFTAIVSASDYEVIMGQNIQKLYQTQNPTELVELANAFDRIAQTETKKWLPLYYASYANLSVLFFNQSLSVDEKNAILDKAQLKLDEAKKITETESEIYALQAFIFQMRITDPSLGYQFSTLSNEALGRAEKLNINNPRVFYLRGNVLFHTPSEYGGGPAVAKPLFEKAAGLFAAETKTRSLMPSWGSYHNNMMLEQCK